jgi:hypothetical protein
MLQGALGRPASSPMSRVETSRKIHLSSRLNSILTAATPSSAPASDSNRIGLFLVGRVAARYSAPVKFWRTRHDSNVWPSPSEGDALSS